MHVHICFPSAFFTPILGVVLTREIKKLPRSKCWFVASKVDAVDMAHKFNERWETDLTVGRHDCRDYTNGKNLFFTSRKFLVLQNLS